MLEALCEARPPPCGSAPGLSLPRRAAPQLGLLLLPPQAVVGAGLLRLCSPPFVCLLLGFWGLLSRATGGQGILIKARCGELILCAVKTLPGCVSQFLSLGRGVGALRLAGYGVLVHPERELFQNPDQMFLFPWVGSFILQLKEK